MRSTAIYVLLLLALVLCFAQVQAAETTTQVATNSDINIFKKIKEGFQKFGKKVKEGFQKAGKKIKEGFQTAGKNISRFPAHPTSNHQASDYRSS